MIQQEIDQERARYWAGRDSKPWNMLSCLPVWETIMSNICLDEWAEDRRWENNRRKK